MVEKLIAEMREKGADDNQIYEALEHMAYEGKSTPEDFEHAKGLLHAGEEIENDEDKEKEEASRLFGMKLL